MSPILSTLIFCTYFLVRETIDIYRQSPDAFVLLKYHVTLLGVFGALACVAAAYAIKTNERRTRRHMAWLALAYAALVMNLIFVGLAVHGALVWFPWIAG